MAALPVVAVVNTNPDLVELLKARIEAAGFIALVIHIADIRAGLDVGAALSQHDPKVIVYDVVAPFQRNWRFLSTSEKRHSRAAGSCSRRRTPRRSRA